MVFISFWLFFFLPCNVSFYSLLKLFALNSVPSVLPHPFLLCNIYLFIFFVPLFSTFLCDLLSDTFLDIRNLLHLKMQYSIFGLLLHDFNPFAFTVITYMLDFSSAYSVFSLSSFLFFFPILD